MKSLNSLAAIFAILSAASPTCIPGIPDRPHIVPAPFNTGRDMPCSPPRDEGRYCYVKAGCGPDRDDAPRILQAVQKCNEGGTVVFDKSYLINSRLDLTFLRHIDIVITGEIHFTDDVYHWAEESFKYDYQNQSVFWKFGGEDVNIYGDLGKDKSVMDGHGQLFWEECFVNKTVSSRCSLPELGAFEGRDETNDFLSLPAPAPQANALCF